MKRTWSNLVRTAAWKTGVVIGNMLRIATGGKPVKSKDKGMRGKT